MSAASKECQHLVKRGGQISLRDTKILGEISHLIVEVVVEVEVEELQ